MMRLIVLLLLLLLLAISILLGLPWPDASLNEPGKMGALGPCENRLMVIITGQGCGDKCCVSITIPVAHSVICSTGSERGPAIVVETSLGSHEPGLS